MTRFISSTASMFAFGVAVLSCFAAGDKQQIIDSISDDQINDALQMDDADFQDATVLLQLEATTQSKVREVKVAHEPREKRPDASSCSILATKPTSSPPYTDAADTAAAPAQREPEQQLLETAVVGVKQPSDAGGILSMVLRAVLQVAILAIVADGMRRYREQQKDVAKCTEIQSASAAKSSITDKCAALLAAVRAGDFGEARAQVQAGADVAADDIWGCTALHATASSPERLAPKFARLLLRQGSKVDARDAIDETPLFLAARAGNNEIIELLLEFGAEIDAVNLRGWTPLVAAAQENQEHTCKFLLSRGAGPGDIAELQQRQSLPPLLIELLGLPELPPVEVSVE